MLAARWHTRGHLLLRRDDAPFLPTPRPGDVDEARADPPLSQDPLSLSALFPERVIGWRRSPTQPSSLPHPAAMSKSSASFSCSSSPSHASPEALCPLHVVIFSLGSPEIAVVDAPPLELP